MSDLWGVYPAEPTGHRPADSYDIDRRDGLPIAGNLLHVKAAAIVEAHNAALTRDPSAAEVEAAARVIYEQTDWSGLPTSAWEHLDDREDYYPLARAALLAARDARLGGDHA